MFNIFQLAANETTSGSVYYLGQIFGNVGLALVGTGPSLIGNMFKVFNTSVLVLGVFIVTYTTVVGVLQTAHEGAMLGGKKWHGLWVPLRMVFGIAALMPTGTGYCAIQVLVMWLIVQGVGAADTLWNVTVNYFAAGGNLQPIEPVDVSGVIPQKMEPVFGKLVCAAYTAKIKSNDATAQPVYSLDSSMTGYSFSDGNSPAGCGSVTWAPPPPVTPDQSDPKAVQAAAVAADKNASMQPALLSTFQSVVPVFANIANYYVNKVIETPACWNACDPNDIAMDATSKGTTKLCPYFERYKGPNFSNSACFVKPSSNSDKSPSGNTYTQDAWNDILSFTGTNFMTDTSRLIRGYAANYAVNYDMQHSEKTKTTGTYLENAKQNGWIFAGSFYYAINRNTSNTQDDFASFVYRISGSDYTPDSDGIIKQLYAGATKDEGGNPGIGELAVQGMSNAGLTQNGVVLGAATGPAASMRGPMAAIFGMFQNMLAPGNNVNPLVAIQDLGDSMLRAASALFWTFFVVGGVAGALSEPYEVIFGMTINPFIAGFSRFALSYLTPAVFMVIATLISLGGLLGVYTPLIPYILFTFGAIGWLIISIEAMIAAPIVAIGILSPGGQHEILGRADPAIMILLNIFLRPSLMIFGMMTGMLLSYIVIKFINAAFYQVVGSIQSSNDLIEGFLFIVAYAGLIIGALNKCFSLIHHVPDKVLRWLGAGGEGMGEEQALQGVKGTVSAGEQAGASALKSAGDASQQAQKARQDIKKKLGKGRGLGVS